METYNVLINNCYGGYGFSDEFLEKLKELTGFEHPLYHTNRHDIRLIGLYNAFIKSNINPNNNCSEIIAIELPIGVNYELDEYDGYESITPYIPVTVDELTKGLSQEKLKLLSFTTNLKII
jgi:hypothetical protein